MEGIAPSWDVTTPLGARTLMNELSGPVRIKPSYGNAHPEARPAFTGASPAHRRAPLIRVRDGRVLHVLLVCCAVALWLISLGGVNIEQMTDLGLLSILTPGFYAALVLLIVSYCVLVHRPRASLWLVLLHLVVLIVIVHGTPVLLYETLRYGWAWKHVGIVDYIQRHGNVDPTIAAMNAYHNWPGFFAGATLLIDASGLANPLAIAIWGPVYFNLLLVGAIRFLLRALTDDERQVHLGTWLYFLTSWVGQDYFAPQALGYFLHILVVGMCLTWFGLAPAPPDPVAALLRRLERRGLVQRLTAGFLYPSAHSPSQRAGALAIILLFYVVIVVSHQLTPYMTLVALSSLVIFRCCSARGVPVLMAVLALSWAAYAASPFISSSSGAVIGSLLQPADAARSSLLELSDASPGQVLVANVGRALTAAVWGLAGVGALRRLRHGRWDLTTTLLAATPFAMLAGNAYGGEILFRVYLFALPAMAFFVAGMVYPRLAAGISWQAAVFSIILSATLLAGFCFAYYGKEQVNRFSKHEVAAAEYLYRVAPPGSHIIEGTPNWPSRYRNYEFHTYWTLSAVPRDRQNELLVDEAPTIMAEVMGDPKYAEGYLIITRSQKSLAYSIGAMQPGTLEATERALLASGRFTVIYRNPDAVIFTLSDTGTDATT